MTSLPTRTNTLDSKAYWALMVVYLIWGTTMGAMRIGIDSIPPAVLACVRFFLSGLLLIGFCRLKGEPWPTPGNMKHHLIVGFLLFFGGNSFSCWALQYISTGLAGILIATNPFWMVGISSLLPPREKISILAMTGLLIGFLGLVILLYPQITAPETVSVMFWVGVAAILVLSFFWSAGSIYTRVHHVSDSILMSLGFQNLLAAIMLLPVCSLTGGWDHLNPTMPSAMALLYLVLFGTIAATPCYYYVLKELPVSVASTFAYVTPVITVLFGWLVLNEVMTAYVITGSCIILAGVMLVMLGSQKPAPLSDRPVKIDPAKGATP